MALPRQRQARPTNQVLRDAWPIGVQAKKISRQAEELSLFTVFITLDGHPGRNLIELIIG
jgi:hypothetical protein